MTEDTCHCGRPVHGDSSLGPAALALCVECLPARCDAFPADCPFKAQVILCPLCSKMINKNDKTSWKEVRGWVGGPKKDHMRLREDTGRFAHGECVQKILDGQAPDQPSIFEEPAGPPVSSWSPGPEELFTDNQPE